MVRRPGCRPMLFRLGIQFDSTFTVSKPGQFRSPHFANWVCISEETLGGLHGEKHDQKTV